MQRNIIHKTFRDKDGKIVVGQTPNAVMVVALVAMAIRFVASGTLSTIAGVIGCIAWIIWALLEMFSGVNYFRRALGTVVVIISAVSLIQTIT